MAIQDEYVVAQIPQPRHFGPAPLWIMGHNTNSIQQVKAALDQGANAVEIDVTAYEHDLDQLCIDHAGLLGDAPGGKDAPAFIPFLHELREVVDQRPALCMVMFDLKPPASHPKFGPVMMQAIRDILTAGTTLSVILSDATETGVFDAISKDVRAREGLMIDADSDVDRVVHFFADQHKVARFGYGNGTSFPLSDEGAMVYRTPIEKACWLRATQARPRFVDAWTVNSVANLQLYLRLGVDALICDAQGIERVRQLLQQAEFSQRHRLALRSDDPMDPDNFAYGLSVVTSSVGSAGTDAKITFTLHGDKGSAATVVDTNFNARMEAGSTNFVVLHAPDLGALEVGQREQRHDRQRARVAPGLDHGQQPSLRRLEDRPLRHAGSSPPRWSPGTWRDLGEIAPTPIGQRPCDRVREAGVRDHPGRRLIAVGHAADHHGEVAGVPRSIAGWRKLFRGRRLRRVAPAHQVYCTPSAAEYADVMAGSGSFGVLGGRCLLASSRASSTSRRGAVSGSGYWTLRLAPASISSPTA